MKMRVHSVVICAHKQGDYVPPQTHNCYEVILYGSGSGKTTINGTNYKYRKGSLAIIPPNVEHDEYTADETDVFCCLFDFKGFEIKLEKGVYYIPDPEYLDRLISLILEIHIELHAKQHHYKLYLNFLLGQFIITFYRSLESSTPSKEIEFACDYLNKNYNINVNLNILAEQTGYSYDRFRHLFKEKTGQTPYQYLLNVRIEKAKELLKNTDYSIQQIAKMSYLGDTYQFTKKFKARTNMTPLKYRKTIGKDPDKIDF